MPPYRRPLALAAVQDALNETVNVPFCTGTVQLNALQSILFYRVQGKSRYIPRFIDFADPSEAQLHALDKACFPASLRMNNQGVLDESYRNIREMDNTDFAIQFSPLESGVFQNVVDALFKLMSEEAVDDVSYELYKLNVYGPGSFFKSHVDVSSSRKIIGFLVVVLPTPHTGGSMIFRHHGTEYTFDSAKEVSNSSTDAPHAAFAAFYTNVEHEVTEVTSGYRITLTYNLCQLPPKTSKGPSGIKMQNQTFPYLKAALASLLSSPDFLSDGGLLTFGLSKEYSFKSKSTKLSDIGMHLKGVDALLKQACGELKLEASLKTLYCETSIFNDEVFCFMDKFVPFNDVELEEELVEHFRECYSDGAIIGYNALSGTPAPTDEYGDDILGVVWAKPPAQRNVFKEKYAVIGDGDKSTVGWAYEMVCFVVHIKPASERT